MATSGVARQRKVGGQQLESLQGKIGKVSVGVQKDATRAVMVTRSLLMHGDSHGRRSVAGGDEV